MPAYVRMIVLVLVLLAPAGADARLVAYSSNSCDQGGTPPPNSSPPAGCASSVWVSNSDGTGARRLTNGTLGDGGPTWSPDGGTIVYVRGEAGKPGDFFGQKTRIWAMNADGSGQRPLTEGGQYGEDADPHFSADGTRIVFISSRVYDYVGGGGAGSFGPTTLFTIAADGTDLRQLNPRGTVASPPSWTPDGNRMYFGLAQGDPDQAQIGQPAVMYAADSYGNDPQVVALGDSLSLPAFSPNGRYVAFATTNWDAFVLDLSTGTGRLASPPYVLIDGWDPRAPATLQFIAYHYDAQARQFEDFWTLDLTAPKPQHVASAAFPDTYPVPQPDPGEAVPSPTLPPLAIAVSRLGPPTPFTGGPLPPDPWYTGPDAGPPAPPAGRQAPPAADPRDALRFIAVAPAGLAAVRVSLGRRLKHGRCRFLGVGGRLGRGDSCAGVHLVSTGGRSRWLTVVAHLPHGTYYVRFQAVDRRHRRQKLRGRPQVVRI